MDFLHHRQGPGSITFEAAAVIAEISSQIMQDYLEEVKQQTEVALDCAQGEASSLMKAGENERNKSLSSGIAQIVGGIASFGMAAGTSIYQAKTFGQSSAEFQKMNNIDETLDILNKHPSNNGTRLSMEGFSDNIPQIKENVQNHFNTTPERALPDTVYQRPTDNAIFTKEQLADLPLADKEELKTALNKQKRDIDIEYKKLSNKSSSLSQFIQLANQLGNTITGMGSVIAATYSIAEAEDNAAKVLAEQSRQFTKETNEINSQGAQQAYNQAAEAFEKIYHNTVNANCRA